MCFNAHGWNTDDECGLHVQVGVVRCGGFLLWRLPDAPHCPLAYCAAPSGLFGG